MQITSTQHDPLKSRGKLLIVDDDDSVTNSLRLFLSADYAVHSASAVHSGIDLFSTLDPDLVLLDLKLPDGDGLDVLRKIRSADAKTPVIVLTGYASTSTVEEAFRLGASDCLHKPFDGKALKDRIRQLVVPAVAERPPEAKSAEWVRLPADQFSELQNRARTSAMFMHDASNPVMAALAATQFLCDVIENSPADFSDEMRDACEILCNSMGFLSGLFEQSAAIECVRHLQKSEVPLDRLVDLAGKMARPVADKARVALSVCLPNEADKVFVNRFALARVLLNLLRNAIEAVKPGSGEVVLTGGIEGGFAEFSVVDNGPGIPPEIIGRIFEAQFTTKPKGTGLGLSICKSLVEIMDGTLSVRNEPGQGCRFGVRIPCQ